MVFFCYCVGHLYLCSTSNGLTNKCLCAVVRVESDFLIRTWVCIEVHSHTIYCWSLRSLLAGWCVETSFARTKYTFFTEPCFVHSKLHFRTDFQQGRYAHFAAIVRDNLSIPNAHVQTCYIGITQGILRLCLQEIISYKYKFKWLCIL